MIDARLQVALAAGLDLPQEGPISVTQPPPVARLPGLPQDRTHVIHDFEPFYSAWAARGYATATALESPSAACIVCLPRAKAEARVLIAQACARTEGVVVVDGQKTDGVDSILKEVRARCSVSGPIAKAHGKLFWFDAPGADTFADWAAGPALTPGGFWTAPGVFSANAIDPGSALLADALPDRLGRHVVDLGAGWGFLSAHVLTRDDIETVHLVEAGHMALECAKRNVTDPRAAFHWADATTWQSAGHVDAVVMNPPFHTGRAADPQIGRAFIAAAARMLSSQGQLWMVANRHLPYEEHLDAGFAHLEEVGSDARFKLFHAARPKRQRRTQ
ncbi:MAG: class I SAM-dependent methyltransferase [Pseudomonadota bacterium]